jgi:hypothetical protein
MPAVHQDLIRDESCLNPFQSKRFGSGKIPRIQKTAAVKITPRLPHHSLILYCWMKTIKPRPIPRPKAYPSTALPRIDELVKSISDGFVKSSRSRLANP